MLELIGQYPALPDHQDEMNSSGKKLTLLPYGQVKMAQT